LIEFIEENKKLKEVNTEYNNKLIEAVQIKMPHLITSGDLRSSGEDFTKTLEILKTYNEELSNLNILLEEKLIKSLERAKKYKDMVKYLSYSNRDISLSPDTHIILGDKKLGKLSWYLITEKDTEIGYNNTAWIKSAQIDVSKYNYQEDDKEKQIDDLININRELLIKLENKDDMISYRDDYISIEKFQLVLENLTDEQEKLRVANYTLDKLKKENEDLKNIIELSK
jgi:hypothetical protein